MTAPAAESLMFAASRARKVSALLGLAHLEGVPIPTVMNMTTYEGDADLQFHADPEEFEAWSKWLPRSIETHDHHGKRWTTATASHRLEQWGLVTVQFTKSEPLEES